MKTISFVIPVYNEEKRIKKTFTALTHFSVTSGYKLVEILFVDDGSTDATRAKILRFMAKNKKLSKIKLLSYGKNQGKGYAVAKGLKDAVGDYALVFDADISTPLSELAKFVPFMEKGIDVIVGTRKNGQSTVLKHQPKYRELLGRGFTKLSQVILGVSVTDFTCGFKAFSQRSRKTIVSQAMINRWGYDAELLFLAQKYNFSMVEKAVTWSNDENTKVNILVAVPQTIRDLLRIRIVHGFRFSAPRYSPIKFARLSR